MRWQWRPGVLGRGKVAGSRMRWGQGDLSGGGGCGGLGGGGGGSIMAAVGAGRPRGLWGRCVFNGGGSREVSAALGAGGPRRR